MRYIKKKDWIIQPVSKPQAREFITEYHYGHGAGCCHKAIHGLYYQGDPFTLHGIAWWNPPPLGAAKSVNPADHRKVLGLSRFCLLPDRPENSGSFLISRSIKMLDPGYEVLLTYADLAMNHNGGLYRASNWNYKGKTRQNPVYWDNETDSMVSSLQGKNSYNRAEMIAQGYEYRGKSAKHKFIYPIQRKRISNAPVGKQFELAFTEQGKINEFINQTKTK